MKLVRVKPEEYTDKGVPLLLVRAVKALNEMIAISPRAVTEALGHGDHILHNKELQKFLDHPFAVVGDLGQPNAKGVHEFKSGLCVLSGLGILNGLIMTPRFRLFVETTNNNYLFKEFGIFEDVEWKEAPCNPG